MRERYPPVIKSKKRNIIAILEPNKHRRINYGHAHTYETVESLWQYIHYTDEAHIDRVVAIVETIFREEGNEEGLLREQPDPNHLVVHIAASISWHYISKLLFYHDGQWTH